MTCNDLQRLHYPTVKARDHVHPATSGVVYAEGLAFVASQRAQAGHSGVFSSEKSSNSPGSTGISNHPIGIADGECPATGVTRKCTETLQPSCAVPEERMNAGARVRIADDGRPVIDVEGGTVVVSGQCSQINKLTASPDKGSGLHAVKFAGLPDHVTGQVNLLDDGASTRQRTYIN